MITSDELLVRLLLTGYRSLARPVLFTLANGDPEEIHQHVITLLSEIPDPVPTGFRVRGTRRDPVTVAGVDFPTRGCGRWPDKDGWRLAPGARWLRFRRTRNRDRPRPARQPAAAAVPDAAQPGDHQPDGVQQLGRRSAGSPARPVGRAARKQCARLSGGRVDRARPSATPLEDAVDDYLHSLRTIAPYADYVAINVSSPNTPGLRSLQDREALTSADDRPGEHRRRTQPGRSAAGSSSWRPIWRRTMWAGSSLPVRTPGLSGLIATNTTTAREYLHPPNCTRPTRPGDCPVPR